MEIISTELIIFFSIVLISFLVTFSIIVLRDIPQNEAVKELKK
ncbi:MAG TPA: hypothetical protein VLN45_06725 [Ignavibacteriaceae bacterium]|nr:hypothetical protein [Ignavibacteriaceae bacterium]